MSYNRKALDRLLNALQVLASKKPSLDVGPRLAIDEIIDYFNSIEKEEAENIAYLLSQWSYLK